MGESEGLRLTREILSDPGALGEIAAARDEIARGDVVRWVAGFPGWEWWTGVNGLLYARRLKSSPPRVVRAGTYDVLLEQIKIREAGG